MARHNLIGLFESRKGHLDYRLKRDYVKNGMVGYPNSRRVMNRDSAYKDRYCITNGVEAIIDEETFNRVQEEKKRRSPFEEGPDGKRRRTTKYSSKIRNGITTISAETEE